MNELLTKWEVLDAACDDETRQAEDFFVPSSLYEVIKLGIIVPDSKVCHHPRVAGSALNDLVALSLDSTLFVFGGNGSELLVQLILPNNVENIAWLPGGDFVIVSDINATVHLLHVGSKKVLFSKKLDINVSTKRSRVFILAKSFMLFDETVSILLISSCGNLVRINNIDTAAILEGIKAKDMPYMASLYSQLEIITEKIFDENLEAYCASVLPSKDMSCLWIWVGTCSGIYAWTSKWIHSGLPQCYKLTNFNDCNKIIPIYGGRYIMASNHQGFHIIWAQRGLTKSTILDCNNTIVHDFIELGSHDNGLQLLLLVSEKGKSNKTIQILSVPDGKITYELSVQTHTILLNLGQGVESVIFVEPDVEDGTIISVKLKSIVDGVPTIRLQKLLDSGRFSQAEEFCGIYDLDVSEVHKAKVKYLCSLLSPWKPVATNTTVFDPSKNFIDLIESLDRIQDLVFVSTVCVNTALPDITYVKKLFTYGRDRLISAAKVGGDYLTIHMQLINENLYTLSTLNMLDPSADVQDWFSFSRADIMDQFFDFLIVGKLDIAAVIWHRHHYKFAHKINESTVMKILKSLPSELKCKDICHFLEKHVLGDIIKLCSSALDKIAVWADNRLRPFEKVEKSNWPDNGFQLVNVILQTLQKIAQEFSAGGDIELQMALNTAQWNNFQPGSSLYELRQTAMALQQLKELSDKFSIRISYSDYRQECKKSVVWSILDCLFCGDEIAPVMDGFLREFIMQKDLDHDQTLAEYVNKILTSQKQEWWFWEAAPWENKLYAIIDIIIDAEVKAKCCVECVQAAPVPWSSGTENMYKTAISLDTTVRSELEVQYKLSKLKLILRNHNMHWISFDEPRKVQLILKHVAAKDQPDTMDELLVIVAAFRHLKPIDAYKHRITHLVMSGNSEACRSILLKLEACDRIKLSEWIMNLVTQHLQVPPLTRKCRERLSDMAEVVISLTPILQVDLSCEYVCLLPIIKRLSSIQRNFNMFPSLDNLLDKKTCINHLRSYIDQLFGSKIKTQAKPKLNVTLKSMLGNSRHITKDDYENDDTKVMCIGHLIKIQKLANLLGLANHEILSQLPCSKTADLLFYARKLVSLSSGKDGTKVVFEIMAQMATRWEKNKPADTFSEPTERDPEKQNTLIMIDALLTDLLMQPHENMDLLLELTVWCQIAKYLYKQSYGNDVHCGDLMSDPYSNWTFSDIFNDSSMPIEEDCIDSFVISLFKMYSTLYKRPESIDNIYFEEAITCLVNHLKGRDKHLWTFIILKMATASKFSTQLVTTNEVSFLFQKIVVSDQNDLSLSVYLLTLIPVKEALKLINDLFNRLGCKFERVLFLANIGLKFCELQNLNKLYQQFALLKKGASWGIRLQDIGVSYKPDFKQDSLEKTLKEIVTKENCSPTVIYDFCKDFNFDIESALFLYLIACIRSWSPTVKNDIFSKPPSSLVSRCRKIISKITDKDLLYDTLFNEFSNTCPYNYETIEHILLELTLIKEQSEIPQILTSARDLLNFLKLYRRSSLPSTFEEDDYKKFTGKQELPVLANTRLPFHILLNENPDANKIINQEVNVFNFKKWVIMCEILRKNKDEICFIAALNTLETTLKEQNTKYLNICSTYSSLLGNIQTTISCITNLELATACANKIVLQLPSGADKVTAAKKCSILAYSYMCDTQTGKSIEFHRRFTARYRTLAIEHALHQYKLAENQYLSLVHDPVQLVHKLYEHSSLSSLALASTQSVPDINGCVQYICKVIGIDKNDMQQTLLRKWLPDVANLSDSTEETVSNFRLSLMPVDMESQKSTVEASLSRIIYLIRGCISDDVIQYLSKLALSDATNLSMDVRLKALRSLLATADQNQIESVTGRTLSEIKSLLQSITYVCRLDEVGHATTLNQFETINKLALVEGLWKSLKHNQTAVLLVVDICLDFKIHTASIWSAIIGQLSSFVVKGLMDIHLLEQVLFKTNMLPQLWLLPQTANAWNILLTNPFEKASKPINDESLKLCARSVAILLQHCPVDVNSNEMVLLCLNLDLPVLALAVHTTDYSTNREFIDILNGVDRDLVIRNYETVKNMVAIPRSVEGSGFESSLRTVLFISPKTFVERLFGELHEGTLK